MARNQGDFGGTSFYLIGAHRSGKSSTGNTLLGKRAFMDTPTVTIKNVQSVLKNLWTVEVVDGPSLVGRPFFIANNTMKLFKNEVFKSGSSKVFLFVFRFNETCTTSDFSEYNSMLGELPHVFGQDVFAHHGIIIVTHGDKFRAKYEGTFESWWKSQIQQKEGLGKLIKRCGGRIVLVDNLRGESSDHLFEKLHGFMPGISYGTMPFEVSRFRAFVNFFWYRPTLLIIAVVLIVIFGIILLVSLT